jgi:hypothetical protein
MKTQFASEQLVGDLFDRGAPPKDMASSAPATPAGKYIYQRFNVCPVIADLVASLAGLGPDRRAA